MSCSEIAKSHRGSKGNTATGVIAAHDACGVIADRIQTFNDFAITVKHPGLIIRLQTRKTAKFARPNSQSKIRPYVERRKRRILPRMPGITLCPPISVGTPVKIRVKAIGCVPIKRLNRLNKRLPFNTNFRCERRQAFSGLYIARLDPPAHRHRPGSNHPQAVATNRTTISDEPGFDIAGVFCVSDHGLDEIVIRT